LQPVELTGVFFNPNIHPYAEHRRRHDTLLGYANRIGLPLIGEPRYDITAWLRQVHGKEEKGVRCRICIHERLRYTAELATTAGFDAFSTTLLVSPYQEHEIIREEGERAAADHGVEFSYLDLRPRYRRSIELSREAELYRQRYCGCIYSEAEAAR
jgi:predicted adenine nucleotide alpha hydrolase (AANH) superfamily ATPase